MLSEPAAGIRHALFSAARLNAPGLGGRSRRNLCLSGCLPADAALLADGRGAVLLVAGEVECSLVGASGGCGGAQA